MTDLQKATNRITSFFNMVRADAELAEEPLKDTDVIVSFMGSGCSDALTVKHFRDLETALMEELNGPTTGDQ